MSEESRTVPGAWGAKRRAVTWVNAALQVVLLGGLLVMVTLIASRRPARFDLTSQGKFAVSEFTDDLLRDLDYDVDIWFVHPLPSDDRSLPVASERTVRLLEEFIRRTGRLRVHEVRGDDPAQVMTIRQNWGLISPGTLYLMARIDRDGRTAVNKKDIDLYQLFQGDSMTGEVSQYRGEPVLARAIRDLGGSTGRVFYEVEGHSEVLTADPRMLGALKSVLEQNEGVEIRRLKTTGVRNIPLDCDVLMILGPSEPYTESEVALLRDYLERGGGLIVALQPRVKTGLEEFLLDYGVRVGDNTVLDPENYMAGDPKYLVVRDFSANHPLNRGMVNVTFRMPGACTVDPVPKDTPGWKIVPLARSGPRAWAETGPVGKDARPSADTEIRGPQNLIVAVEKPATLAEGGDRPARLSVWGSVFPFTNEILRGGDRQLQYLLNHLRWLGERRLMDAEPEAISVRPLTVSADALGRLWWVTVVGMPAFGVILGIVVWFARRK